MNSKLYTILIAIFVMGITTSCVKERSCTCEVYVDNVKQASSTLIIKDTKKNAQEECEKSTQGGSSPTRVECKLD